MATGCLFCQPRSSRGSKNEAEIRLDMVGSCWIHFNSLLGLCIGAQMSLYPYVSSQLETSLGQTHLEAWTAGTLVDQVLLHSCHNIFFAHTSGWFGLARESKARRVLPACTQTRAQKHGIHLLFTDSHPGSKRNLPTEPYPLSPIGPAMSCICREKCLW